MPSIRFRRETVFALLLVVVFLAAAGFVASRHEIWRDEAQAWLIAKDSRSLDDLALRIKFDGHPALWYWGLFLLTRFTSSPAAMQAFHLFLAAAAVFLFARFAPFSRLIKILFAFSYYAFFEYGVITRNYSLGVLLLFAFCAVYPKRDKSLLGPSAVLFLLAQTNIHMLILAVALTLVLAAERWFKRRRPRPRFQATGMLMTLAGLAAGIYQVIPDASSIFSKSYHIYFQPDKVFYIFRLIAKSYLAIPDPQIHFWNLSLLDHFSFAPVTTHLLAALLLLFALAAFLDRPLILGFFAMATGALGVFFYFAYQGYLRHHGHFFLVFLAGLWLAARTEPPSFRMGPLRTVAVGARRIAPVVLAVILAVQAAGSVIASVYEIRFPFSQGRRAADYIRAQNLQDWVLIGDFYYCMSSVSAYLDRPIYFPVLEQWGSYARWIEPVHRRMSMTYVMQAAERLSGESGKDYLVILSYPLDADSLATRGLRPVAGFGTAIIRDEGFFLYRKEKRSSPHARGVGTDIRSGKKQTAP